MVSAVYSAMGKRRYNVSETEIETVKSKKKVSESFEENFLLTEMRMLLPQQCFHWWIN